jgi:hypothetical protein
MCGAKCSVLICYVVCVVCRGECAILLDDANLLSLKLFRTPPDVGAVAEHQVQLLLYLLLRIHERLQWSLLE